MIFALACLAGRAASAAILPYTPDANTLHLWHFDELATPCADTAPGGTNLTYLINGATLGNASYSDSLINFTNCISLGTLSTSNAVIFPSGSGNVGNAIPFTYAGASGAFTYEAMVHVEFNPASNYSTRNQPFQIMDCDGDTASGTRVFQFRVDPIGFASSVGTISAIGLEFINGTATVAVAPIPTTGPDAIVSNAWFHVAVAYSGSANTTSNLLFYWTLMSSTRTNADCIYGTNMTSDLPGTSAATTIFSIGNSARNPGGGSGAAAANFPGRIDEVRISSVARTANQMLFSLPVTPTVISPANPVYAGTPATLSATVAGLQPTVYAWQSDGSSGGVTWTNLPNSITNTYQINTTGMAAGNYQYRLVVSGSGSNLTNSPATMNLVPAAGPVLVTNTTITPTAVFAGGAASLAASFTGTQPIGYQWFFITNGGGTMLIAGATNTAYTIASAQTNNAGSYFLLASNHPPGLGSQTLASSPGTLNVLPTAGPIPTMYCELLGNPAETAITAVAPKFGWNYTPTFRGDYQARYRVLVASSLALANAGTGDLWDSGLVNSSNSINVSYAGAALQPGTNYFWRVQTVNSLGQTGAVSAIQQFNTASQLYNSLTTGGVIYQQPAAGSVNCYPLRYVPVAPVLIATNSLGHYFIDFGKDAFGYAMIALNGNYSGTTVGFGLGELASNNIVNTTPGATIRYWSGSLALGNGSSNYVCRSATAVGGISPPTATYGLVSPFRYLELSGLPAGVTLTTNSITQQRLQTEFSDNAATFSSSSTALNQIWSLCQYSMKALSFDGIYVDGDRERTPYEADTYLHMLGSYAVNYDFTMPRCTFEYLTNHLTWPTEWPMHMVFAAWADYQQTGDPYLMTKYYGFLTNHCLLAGRASTTVGLVDSYPETANTASGDIIDWYRVSGDGIGNTDGYVAESTNAVINAFYYRCLTLMTQIAQLTGHASDAATFAANANLVYSNYNRIFWNGTSFLDGEGTTHASADANFYPLAFGLVPVTNQTAVVNYLHSRIAALGANPAGVYGSQYLLEGLFLAGDADTALGLMTTNNTRSWMNMINLGSTITDEAWSTADKSNEDWNHAWGAAAGNLIPRYVLGLRPLAAGYGQVLIQPQPGVSLAYAQGTVPTIRGPVFISVTNATGQYQLLVNIPGNVTATVMLPVAGATNPVALVDGEIVSGVLSNNWLTVTNLGSGQHAIWLNTTSTVSTMSLYNNWAAAWFGANAANPAIAGTNAEPYGNVLNNYDAFVAGVNPTDPADTFRIVSTSYMSSGPGMAVTITGHAGRHYTLQHSFTLNSPSWTNADNQTATSDSQSITLLDTSLSNSMQAFLRVTVAYP